MSKAPSAVQKAEELADRLQAEFIAKQNSTEGDDGDQTPPPPAPPPAPTSDSPPPKEDDWEHRFKVLQGKYNSEVPRLSEANKDMTKRLTALEQELQTAKAKPPEPLVSAAEIDEYGEGLIDVARRIAREELASKEGEIADLKTRLDQLLNHSTNTAQDAFFTTLDTLAPDWKQINEDAAFIEWLSEIEPFAGATRQSLIGQAEQARDAKRVAKFFTTFAETRSAVATDADESLKRQVAPPRTRTPATPPGKKVWKRSEIADFYGRVRRGEVSDSEAIAIEADITAASIEGRVR